MEISFYLVKYYTVLTYSVSYVESILLRCLPIATWWSLYEKTPVDRRVNMETGLIISSQGGTGLILGVQLNVG